MKYIILIIFSFLIAACSIEEQEIDFGGDEIRRLLSGDSIKQWIRVNQNIQSGDTSLDECSQGIVLIFSYSEVNSPELEFEFRTSPISCGGVDSLLVAGYCMINDVTASSEAIDTITFVSAQDTINYGLIQLTSRMMRTERKIQGNILNEEYRWTEN